MYLVEVGSRRALFDNLERAMVWATPEGACTTWQSTTVGTWRCRSIRAVITQVEYIK